MTTILTLINKPSESAPAHGALSDGAGKLATVIGNTLSGPYIEANAEVHYITM